MNSLRRNMRTFISDPFHSPDRSRDIAEAQPEFHIRRGTGPEKIPGRPLQILSQYLLETVGRNVPRVLPDITIPFQGQPDADIRLPYQTEYVGR